MIFTRREKKLPRAEKTTRNWEQSDLPVSSLKRLNPIPSNVRTSDGVVQRTNLKTKQKNKTKNRERDVQRKRVSCETKTAANVTGPLSDDRWDDRRTRLGNVFPAR